MAAWGELWICEVSDLTGPRYRALRTAVKIGGHELRRQVVQTYVIGRTTALLFDSTGASGDAS
ncbi:hypothetical protein J2X12_004273 [Pseudarthrobacter oxydans]|uniref:Uncharacterized protein n=1 Tax=Pseudarthrobacter oxydans TaxID=1671 RepID=A0AAW8NI21_PSEOX|nr:hypothetical protein [Pseudarthrobacter oxydans]MDR7166219.1 hypothetical protein [Pseudarthrobacter oxydans]